jgi:hypothetical protein
MLNLLREGVKQDRLNPAASRPTSTRECGGQQPAVGLGISDDRIALGRDWPIALRARDLDPYTCVEYFIQRTATNSLYSCRYADAAR